MSKWEQRTNNGQHTSLRSFVPGQSWELKWGKPASADGIVIISALFLND